jgi:PPOX class probable F420-dependent enzyme
VSTTETSTVYSEAQRAFLEQHFVCTVGTVGRDGDAYLSTTLYVLDGDDIVLSTMGSRVKARHVERDGRASISVHGLEQPFPQVVISGPARVERDDIVELTNRIVQLTHFAKGRTFDADEIRAMDRVLVRVSPARVHSQYLG